MLKTTVRDVIAYIIYRRRKENAERYDIPCYGNEHTDRAMADRVIKFFEGGAQDNHTYEDFKMYEGLISEIDDDTQ